MRATILILALIPLHSPPVKMRHPLVTSSPRNHLIPIHRASIRVGIMQWGFLTKRPRITFGSCPMAERSR
jgi:hypothetical protein